MRDRKLHIMLLGLCLVACLAACTEENDDGSVSDAGTAFGDAGAADDLEPIMGSDPLSPLSDEVALPIVFVHGFAGSAQQYQSQAIRFVANGYPQERIYAYEHDGQSVNFAAFVTGAMEVVDQALADHDVEQVYLVGHSRGTFVSNQLLENEAHAAKVAKYISLDGRPCPQATLPCINVTQASIPGQAHVEVAVSAESFVDQYTFLVGEPPEVVDIVPQAAPVEISGRVVFFPENTGRAGTLEIYEIDSETGMRVSDEPHARFEVGDDGFWGPVVVDPRKHYEKALSGEAGMTQHFYAQPYLRSTPFVRLLSGPPDGDTATNTHNGPGHAAVIAMRMREWMDSDVLEVSTSSDSGDTEPVNVITARVAGGGGIGGIGDQSIAIHMHDAAASPGESTLEALPNLDGPFQTTADVYMPASDPPDGTITFRNLPRGDADRPQILRVPNWASDSHMIMLMFSDFTQD